MERVSGDPGKPLVFRQTAVADEAVDPEVRDYDLQRVPALVQKVLGYGNAPGQAPDHPQIAAIDFDRGNVCHRAEIQKCARVWFHFTIEDCFVGCLAGVITNSLLRPLAPIFEFGKNNSFRPAPFWIECHFPRLIERADGFKAGKVFPSRGRRRGRRFTEDNKSALQRFKMDANPRAAADLGELGQMAAFAG